MLIFSVLYFCTHGGPQVLCEGPKEWAPGSSAALINVTGDSAGARSRLRGKDELSHCTVTVAFAELLEPLGECANSGRLGGRLFL